MAFIRKFYRLLLLVVIFVCDAFHTILSVNGSPTGRIVTIAQGRLKGRLSETRSGSFFMEYMGIPYAEPPKRFKTARKPQKWSGILDASHRAPPCFQMKGNISIGQEDCLTLSVATPANHNNYWMMKDMPVIVVFHGGSWMIDRGDWNGGEGSQWGAKHMMDEKVVVVSVNYRLGVFGFFTMFRTEASGNYGLKDQVLALQWVKENIDKFGGNPKLVTIVGQGAGAASVGLHLLSPMSKGLFHRSILQSGSPLCHWALVDDPGHSTYYSYIELEEINCGSAPDNPAQTLECLASKSAKELEFARQKMMDMFRDPIHPFGPVVEHWVRSEPRLQAFLPDYPLNILLNSKNETWGGIPIMMGVNSQDGLNFITGQYIYNSGLKDLYFTNYMKFYPLNFGYGLNRQLPVALDEASQTATTEKIRKFYYPDIAVEAMKQSAYHNIHIDMYSHRNYFQCVKNAAVLYGKWSDIYLYYWTRSAVSFKKWHDYKSLNLTTVGVANGDEVHFLFDTADNYGDFSLIRYLRPTHLSFSQYVVRLWVRFAATGKPADDWQSMKGQSKSNLQWAKIGEEKLMGSEPFTKYTDFWDSLGFDQARELPPPGEVKKKEFNRRNQEKDFIYMDFADEQGPPE